MASRTLCFLAESLWKDNSFSDIDLEYSGHVFRLHRLLLRQSPFLRGLLDETPSHAKAVTLSVSDPYVTAEALQVCLSTLYGLEPVLDEDNILSVLATAFCLQLDALCDTCIAFLPNLLTPALFLELHAFNERWFGKEYNHSLVDILERYLCRTAFSELRSSLHKLPREHLCRLFASNALWVPSESDRFQLAIEVYQSMRQLNEEDTESGDQAQKQEKKLSALIRSMTLPHRDPSPGIREIGRSASGEQPVRHDLSRFAERVHSEPTHSGFDTNNCKCCLPAADCEFLESVLDDDHIFYACFSFADLVKARNQAQNLGLGRIVRCIENSLWMRSTIEGMIITEATRRGDLRSCRSFDKKSCVDLVGVMDHSDECFSPGFRYSTEICDIEAFRSSRDFTSEQFYFCGSLFRVVLTIRFDETSQDHFIGMFLQRTIISSVDSWQFCDPRSNVNVHVEFIAGTRLLEMIELDGRLEIPYNNKGYSRFLCDADLPKYLSPSGSLRITTVLKLIFDCPGGDEANGH